MSSISLHISLTYPSAKHAKLVFKAFSQLPTNTVRSRKPDVKRMEAIKCSMEYISYELATIYQLVFVDDVH